MQSVDGWRLLRLLGKGGQATVYLGEDPDGQLAAVKIFDLSNYTGDDLARRKAQLAREVESARKVPRLCTAHILDVGLDHDPPYIATEYIDGVTLFEKVDRDGPLTGADLDQLTAHTAEVLRATHAAGVIHRDFTPNNVMYRNGIGWVVIDFGIARIYDGLQTRTTARHGTPPYVAPEHFVGRKSPEVDIFAWASTMVFAATGHHAFDGESPAEVYQKILEVRPDLSDVPESLLPIIRRCLQRDPRARPTAEELVRHLRGELAVATRQAPPSDTPHTTIAEPPIAVIPRPRRLVAALLAIATLIPMSFLNSSGSTIGAPAESVPPAIEDVAASMPADMQQLILGWAGKACRHDSPEPDQSDKWTCENGPIDAYVIRYFDAAALDAARGDVERLQRASPKNVVWRAKTAVSSRGVRGPYIEYVVKIKDQDGGETAARAWFDDGGVLALIISTPLDINAADSRNRVFKACRSLGYRMVS
ncbi:serine/threonine protein kinase [Actinoplanes sp. NBC_00393]|uniref:serine/threonine-protein kinase n=1 Tax=Actinoplanes sp. NBC_00393 TaxID=2975953 RepID=UPI002E1F91E0